MVDTARKSRADGYAIIFYFKSHKASHHFDLRSRPIAAAIDYVTGIASNLLHSQLKGPCENIHVS